MNPFFTAMAISVLMVVSFGCTTNGPSGLMSQSFRRPTMNAGQASLDSESKPMQADLIDEDEVHASNRYVSQASFAANAALTKPHKSLRTLGAKDHLFAWVHAAPGVVLLDFYADWCGPCRSQSKILHGLENTAKKDKASIIKINVDQHAKLASTFNVSSLPTLLIIKDGKIVERRIGVTSRSQLERLLAK